MKYLVNLPLVLTVAESAIMYSIVAGEYTVEITVQVRDEYELVIVPTGIDDTLITEPIVFGTLLEAVSNADEMIGELKEL